jgi:hypothetical protein
VIGKPVYIGMGSIGHLLNACGQDLALWCTGVDPWRPAENRLLYSLIRTNGPKWATFGVLFPNRTTIPLKCHWHSHLRLRDEMNAAQGRVDTLLALRPMRANVGGMGALTPEEEAQFAFREEKGRPGEEVEESETDQ